MLLVRAVLLALLAIVLGASTPTVLACPMDTPPNPWQSLRWGDVKVLANGHVIVVEGLHGTWTVDVRGGTPPSSGDLLINDKIVAIPVRGGRVELFIHDPDVAAGSWNDGPEWTLRVWVVWPADAEYPHITLGDPGAGWLSPAVASSLGGAMIVLVGLLVLRLRRAALGVCV